MYLKSLLLENTGPIEEFALTLPFADDRPLPVVLVGPNGSGKSTVFSFIVNALIALKQRVYEDVEVEKGRVYRLRSPLGIRGNANYFHSCARFENDVSIEEWQLDRTRGDFESQLGWTSRHRSWNEISEYESSTFSSNLGKLVAVHEMERVLNSNCALFFAADRFEPPDWLNLGDLSPELKLPDPTPRLIGKTQRRIFSRNRLKPTLQWLASVAFDMLLHEQRDIMVTFHGPTPETKPGRVAVPGPATATYDAVISVLREILLQQHDDELQFDLSDRRSRIVQAKIVRKGVVQKQIRNLLSLSAGESALFCLFASIIRDADEAGIRFTKPEDIRGIVLIDEADLHLHLGLQHKALPKLIKLFPRVQFILSVHSPLVALGMSDALGPEGFVIRELPSGQQIRPEAYSEFLSAFDVYSKTRAFEARVLNQIKGRPKPALLVEGVSDATLIQVAWNKLRSHPLPFEIIPCGIEPVLEARNGGAEMLRRCLEFLSIASDRATVAVFDNDRIGNEQFAGINKKAFDVGIDPSHKKHKTQRSHALLLPVPAGREGFVTLENMGQRYLSIEHYFSDAILAENGMKGPSILGTAVFEIVGDKVGFASKAAAFAPSEFAQFECLFSRLDFLTIAKS